MSQQEVNQPSSVVDEVAAQGVETFAVLQATAEAQDAQVSAAEDILERARPEDSAAAMKALEAILEGASPDDAAALKAALLRWQKFEAKMPVSPDDELVDDWRTAVYPYKNRLSRKTYEKQKYHLQVELLKLQAWVKETGQRVVILFEGRDAAGAPRQLRQEDQRPSQFRHRGGQSDVEEGARRVSGAPSPSCRRASPRARG